MAEYEENYFCFSCHTWIPKDRSRVTMRVKHKPGSMNESVQLPFDFTLTIPSEIRDSLISQWFSPRLLRSIGIGWSETTTILSKRLGKEIKTGRRLIIPVYENGNLVAWEAKSFSNLLKYVHIGHKDPIVMLNEDSNALVIVEDLLSAYRIQRFYNVGCLRGSAATQRAALKFIATKPKSIVIWTDSDKAGIDCAKRLYELLDGICTVGTAIINIAILGYKDPKCYQDCDIVDIIEGVTYV